jgi:hypothetical protein
MVQIALMTIIVETVEGPATTKLIAMREVTLLQHGLPNDSY